MVVVTNATSTHCTFHFEGAGLPQSIHCSWSGSVCRVHIALQKLQAVALMLCQMALHLAGKVVVLHLDNTTVKAYLCNQCGTVSPFLSRLAFPYLIHVCTVSKAIDINERTQICLPNKECLQM